MRSAARRCAARTRGRAAPHRIAALDHVSSVVLVWPIVDAKATRSLHLVGPAAGFDPADLHGCVVVRARCHPGRHRRGDPGRRGALRVHRQERQPTLLALEVLWAGSPSGPPSPTAPTTDTQPAPSRSSTSLPYRGGAFFQRRPSRSLRHRDPRREEERRVTYVDPPRPYHRHHLPPWPPGVKDTGPSRTSSTVARRTYDEDRSQVRTGAGPHVMASLRNTADRAPSTGRVDQHAALRHHARNPERPSHAP